MRAPALAEPEVWDDTLPSVAGGRGMYVAVSGNTASGKSSLIHAVVASARDRGLPVVGIGERLLHHPYLRLMFAEPDRFAFPIQLNFMLQRHLVLVRNLGLGRIVIVERSHFDDEVFVREHFEAGRISPRQLQAYRALAEVLHAQLAAPDILVLLSPTPEVSIARLRCAEERHERPREFPDEASKERWVRRWHELYQELHDEYRRLAGFSPKFLGTRLIEHDGAHGTAPTVAELVAQMVAWRGPHDGAAQS